MTRIQELFDEIDQDPDEHIDLSKVMIEAKQQLNDNVIGNEDLFNKLQERSLQCSKEQRNNGDFKRKAYVVKRVHDVKALKQDDILDILDEFGIENLCSD